VAHHLGFGEPRQTDPVGTFQTAQPIGCESGVREVDSTTLTLIKLENQWFLQMQPVV
jgi:hypothetical protein